MLKIFLKFCKLSSSFLIFVCPLGEKFLAWASHSWSRPTRPRTVGEYEYCLLSLLSHLPNITFIFHDFPRPSTKFHDFPGPENIFPGFPWPVQTLWLFSTINHAKKKFQNFSTSRWKIDQFELLWSLFTHCWCPGFVTNGVKDSFSNLVMLSFTKKPSYHFLGSLPT